jgi:hypothetical protein
MSGGKSLRLDKQGNPILVVTSNLKTFLHENIDDVDEDGDTITVKMRASTPFLDGFNAAVLDLLIECVQSARKNERTTMLPEDIPNTTEA